MRHQRLISFFCGVSETFVIANYFSRVKLSLATPKTMYLDTFKFSNALSYAHSVKGYNRDVERTSTIASSVIKLSSSYTYQFLPAGFSRIGWIKIVLFFIWNIKCRIHLYHQIISICFSAIKKLFSYISMLYTDAEKLDEYYMF